MAQQETYNWIHRMMGVDEISGTLNNINAAQNRNVAATSRAAAAQNNHALATQKNSLRQQALALDVDRVNRSFGTYFGTTGLVTQGIQRMGAALNSIIWTAAIAGVTLLILKLKEQLTGWQDNTKAIQDYQKRLREATAESAILRQKVEIDALGRQIIELTKTIDQSSKAIEAGGIRGGAAATNFGKHKDELAGLVEQYNAATERLRTYTAGIEANEEALKNLEGKKGLTDKQKAQEAIGRMILDQAQLERQIRLTEAEEAGRIEEIKGQNILNARLVQMEEEKRLARDHASVQEALGRQILANAQRVYKQEVALEEAKTQARQASVQAAMGFTEALFLFTGSKSKALFEINKIANSANAIMDTWTAVNKALASAPPPYNYALAAAVAAMGLANVARIQSQQFSAAGGGGGVAAGGTAPPPDIGPGRIFEAPEQGQAGPTVQMHVEFRSMIFDKHTVKKFYHESGDLLGEVIKERGGRLADIELSQSRR